MERFNLAEIVAMHSWKEILLNMIYEGKIDPWDVDLDVVIEEFISKIRKVKELDLAIPANLALAAAIVLKYKSLTLMVEEEEEVEEENLNFATERLTLAKRIPPARPITLSELMEAIEEAVKVRFSAIRRREKKQIPLELPKYEREDAKERLKRTFSEMIGLMDDDGWLSFKELIKGKKKEEAVKVFLDTLHLENEGYISTSQEEPFSDIKIKVNEERVIKIE